jgi:hypothetical protein|tara:strand:+ start:266 stop:685 length:420 start_codon:yes stop_codon:yes gene_type:complete
MASVKGVNFTKRTAEPVEKVIASQSHGRLRVQYDSYEASSLASGSDISVAKLPAGAIVYDIVVHFDALGSATIAVGDSADADRYITATSVSSAGQMSMSQEGAIDGFGYENTAETDILLTTGSAAITGTVKCAVFYSMD